MAWEKYLDKSGRSGISEYELKDTGINVKFKNGGEYYYSIDDNDTQTIGEMMSLGDNGEFLNRYVNRHKPNYKMGRDTTEPPPDVDTRPLNDTQVRALTEKFMKRNLSVADQLRAAKWAKMQKEESQKAWMKLRKKR